MKNKFAKGMKELNVQQKVIKILRIGKNETGTKIFAKRVQIFFS